MNLWNIGQKCSFCSLPFWKARLFPSKINNKVTICVNCLKIAKELKDRPMPLERK